MIIKYYTKNVYGVEIVYLSHENQAEINRGILGLTGRKTLTSMDIRHLKLLGYSLERVFI